MSSLDLQMPGPLPAWLPGETLFSLHSRFHQLSGHRLAADTCRALFGSARAGCQHDFPTRLGELCERVQGALGDPADLACQKTLLPFYLPLQSQDRAREAIDALVGSPKGVLKFRLGILTSRFRANHPLKACPECMSADRNAFGTTYWHLVHQLPGVWLCTAHQSALHECKVKSTGVVRFGWILPEETQLCSTPLSEGGECRSSLTKLASLAEAWTAVPLGTYFESTRLAAAYVSQVTRLLGSRALHTEGREALSESFRLAVAPLRVVPELLALPSSAREAWLQIQRWLLAPRGGTHPVRHLAIIHWLFEDWLQFLAAYESTAVDKAEEPPPGVSMGGSARRLEEAFLLGVRSGLSISAAARGVGVTAGTGVAWAAKNEIAVRHRPKTLRPEVRAAVVVALAAGANKVDLAHLHSLPIQAVTRILQTEPRLREAWQRARDSMARDRARIAWSEACWAAVTSQVHRGTRRLPTQDQLERLLQLSRDCGGWIVFDREREETFVSLAEWTALYERWRAY